MLAFKWDHAVRDFLDPEKRFPTLCCLPANRSLLAPPVDECSDPSKYHEARARMRFIKHCIVLSWHHARTAPGMHAMCRARWLLQHASCAVLTWPPALCRHRWVLHGGHRRTQLAAHSWAAWNVLSRLAGGPALPAHGSQRPLVRDAHADGGGHRATVLLLQLHGTSHPPWQALAMSCHAHHPRRSSRASCAAPVPGVHVGASLLYASCGQVDHEWINKRAPPQEEGWRFSGGGHGRNCHGR